MQADQIRVTLPDGRKETVQKGISIQEVLGKLKPSYDGWIAARMNGRLVDLSRKARGGLGAGRNQNRLRTRN